MAAFRLLPTASTTAHDYMVRPSYSQAILCKRGADAAPLGNGGAHKRAFGSWAHHLWLPLLRGGGAPWGGVEGKRPEVALLGRGGQRQITGGQDRLQVIQKGGL